VAAFFLMPVLVVAIILNMIYTILCVVCLTTRVELLPGFKFTGKMVKKIKFTCKIGKNGKKW
jgi:hypothetical protein